MKPTFRKSMIWLHTYVGLVFGWLIFAVFLTGTLSYYNTEISHWIEAGSPNHTAQVTLLKTGIDRLQKEAPDHATSWSIQLPNERGDTYAVSYREANKRRRNYLPETNQTLSPAVETNGGNFFRTFHYTLSLRGWGGRYFTGIAAMCMLLAVFTGIYTHRRFFKDFFTLREAAWDKFLKDLHAVFGVITIPFCFVICFSALLIYISMYIPFVIDHHYDSYRQLDREVSTNYQRINKDSGEYTEHSIAIDAYLPTLAAHWGQRYQLDSVAITAPRNTQGRIVFYAQTEANLSNKPQTLAFSLSTGEVINMPEERLARKVRRIFYGLHEAHFAQPVLRFMLFALGLFSTLLIASGLVIWLQKRRAKRQKAVYVWVEKMNLGMLYGLPLAVAFYLVGSRLPFALPVPLTQFELSAFFYTWLASVVLCLVIKEQQGKALMLWANFIAFSGLFSLDLLPNKGNFVNALSQQNLAYLTVSGLILATAIYFGFVAYRNFSEARHG